VIMRRGPRKGWKLSEKASQHVVPIREVARFERVEPGRDSRAASKPEASRPKYTSNNHHPIWTNSNLRGGKLSFIQLRILVGDTHLPCPSV
jgi:hypothetical protein